MVSAVGSRPTSGAFDAVALNSSTVTLGLTLAKTSPDGKGRVVYVSYLSDEDAKLIPSGITTGKTQVGTAYAEDEACAYLPSFISSEHILDLSSNSICSSLSRISFLPPNSVLCRTDTLEPDAVARFESEAHAERLAERRGGTWALDRRLGAW